MNANIPLSEQWHLAAHRWADLESAASILEDTKSAVLAQMTSRLGDMPVNRAEQTVKSSDEWRDHVAKIGRARLAANKAKIEMEYLKMRFAEWNSAEANHRAQARI